MAVHLVNRSFPFVLGVLVVLSIVVPRTAYAQTTKLVVDSQAGDFVGGGRITSLTTVDAAFTASASTWAGTTVNVRTPGSGTWWTLVFKRPGENAAPGVGVYESARRAPFTAFNGLDVSGVSGCNDLTGRFVVLEAEYGSNGAVVRFAADFEQHCGDRDAGAFGAIRYNSTIASTVPFNGVYPLYRLTLIPPANGTIAGPGINCGPAPSATACVAESSSPATLPIVATPAAGYLFSGWTGDCSGPSRSTVHVNMQRGCSAAFRPAGADGPRTLAVITGTLGSLAQKGGVVESEFNSVWTFSSWQNGFTVRMAMPGPTRDLETSFIITPPSGQVFQAGHEYASASSADATHGSFWSTADSSTCSDAGTFTVRDWAAGSNGLPTRFAIDFQQSCGPSGVYGTLLYQSAFVYGQLSVAPNALHFTAVKDQFGIVSHSADRPLQVTPSGPSTMHWDLKSDQPWLTATPPVAGATSGALVSARIRTGVSLSGTSPLAGHLQVLARGIVNIPDTVTVTLDFAAPDTTSRPFAVFRPGSGNWFMPNQGLQQFGLPGDVPLSGDFDGDGTLDIAIYRPWTGEWFVQGQPTRQWGWVGDIPVPADYNGDGITDLAVFRQSGSSAQWFIFGESASRAWGSRGDVPVPGDYDGDGVADLAVFRPATGAWRILRSSTGQTVVGAAGTVGDIPVVADFDADRKIDFAVFRPSTGFWYVTLSAGGTYSRQFGLPGDIPVPLDVTGDGRAELRVWRPATGMWFSFDRWLSQTSSQQYGLAGDVPVMSRPVLVGSRPGDVDGDRRADVTIYRPLTGEWFTRQSAAAYGTFTTQAWGLSGDIPVAGDYDGDRFADPAVFRPSTGEWFVRRSNGTLLQRAWGLPDDMPVPADYDGDGRTDMAVYRPSSGQWFVLSSTSGYSSYWAFAWGLPGDLPMTGDVDGDGRADATVYRPSTGEWFVAGSAGGSVVRQWGLSGDVPIARDFDGDGRADFAVYRPSTGAWFVLDAASGTLILSAQWGASGDVPAADDYDGDGVADLAVYHPATSEWSVWPSSGAPSFVLQWGLAGDIPVIRR